jgi:hypothetical protein
MRSFVGVVEGVLFTVHDDEPTHAPPCVAVLTNERCLITALDALRPATSWPTLILHTYYIQTQRRHARVECSGQT